MEPWKLYYDGGCNLCHVSQLRAERWAKRASQPIEIDVLQGDDAQGKGYSDGLMTLEADGKIYRGAEAWLRIMEIAPWYLRPVGWMRHVPILHPIARFLYGVVARTRYALFGRRACQLP